MCCRRKIDRLWGEMTVPFVRGTSESFQINKTQIRNGAYKRRIIIIHDARNT